MLKFANLFSKHKKEEIKMGKNELFNTEINEEQLKDIEVDKVVADMENETRLKYLENQRKLEELEVENNELLNIKVSNSIKQVYSYLHDYFSNVKIVIDRLSMCYNKFGVKITDNDIIEIITYISEQTKNCTCLKDFDNIYNKHGVNSLYMKFFIGINYPNKAMKENSILYQVINELSELYAKSSYCVGIHSLNCILIMDDYNSSYMGNNALNDLEKALIDSNNEEWRKENALRTYYQNIFSDIICILLTMNRVLYLNDYIRNVDNNEEFKTVIKNYLFKKSPNYQEIYNIYKEFYSDTFDTVLDLPDFTLLINMYEIYINNKGWEESVHSIFDLLGIDCNKIINDYINLNTYKNICDYSMELLSSKTFETLIMYPKYEILASLYYQYVLFKLIGKISYEKWFLMLLGKNTFIEKVTVYHKKYELLKDRTRIESIIKLNEVLSNVTTGEEFELFLKYLYELMGYKVELTPKTCDQGADLVLEKNNEKVVVQAKFYNSSVGNSAVQEVVAATKYYNADNAVVVTNSTFTKSADDLAEANNVKLIDGNALNGCIKMLV